MLPVNSLAQHPPPALLSQAVYITAAERREQISHITIPTVMQISGHILQFVLPLLAQDGSQH